MKGEAHHREDVAIEAIVLLIGFSPYRKQMSTLSGYVLFAWASILISHLPEKNKLFSHGSFTPA
jgi:hypothetical protein